jgi:hypothetical protein
MGSFPGAGSGVPEFCFFTSTCDEVPGFLAGILPLGVKNKLGREARAFRRDQTRLLGNVLEAIATFSGT